MDPMKPLLLPVQAMSFFPILRYRVCLAIRIRTSPAPVIPYVFGDILYGSEGRIGKIRRTAYDNFDNFVSVLYGETARIARLQAWYHCEEWAACTAIALEEAWLSKLKFGSKKWNFE